eukprot:247268_1
MTDLFSAVMFIAVIIFPCVCYVSSVVIGYINAPNPNWNYCECRKCVCMIGKRNKYRCGKKTPWLIMCGPILIVVVVMGSMCAASHFSFVTWFLIVILPVLIYGCYCGSIIVVCQRCRYACCDSLCYGRTCCNNNENMNNLDIQEHKIVQQNHEMIEIPRIAEREIN